MKQKKQLFILLFVKKLLKFVLFMKVSWKSQKWRIKLLFLKKAHFNITANSTYIKLGEMVLIWR